MNSTIHTRNVGFANWVSGRTALNSFRACAIWMRETTGMKEASFIVPKLLDRGMNAVISMSHG